MVVKGSKPGRNMVRLDLNKTHTDHKGAVGQNTTFVAMKQSLPKKVFSSLMTFNSSFLPVTSEFPTGCELEVISL